MVGILNRGWVGGKRLEPAGSNLAVLDSRIRRVPVFFEDERKAELTSTRPSDTDLQRSDGIGRIVLGGSERPPRIIDVFQKSPVRIMLPRRPVGENEEAVLINTRG